MSTFDFESFIYYMRVAHYTEFACLTAVLYDYLIFADQEIQHFWHTKRGKGWGQLVYFLNRYFMVLYLVMEIFGRYSPYVTNGYCQVFYHHLQSLLPILQTFFAEAAFTYRLLVVLHWQRFFVWTVAPLCLICNAVSLVVSQPPLQALDVAAVAPWGTPGCTIVAFRPPIYNSPIFPMIPVLFFSSLLLFLTIWCTTSQISASPYNRSMLITLLGTIRKQSILFYIATIASMTVNLTVFHKAPLLFITVAPISSFGLSMLSTRLTIIMKDEASSIAPDDIELIGEVSNSTATSPPSSRSSSSSSGVPENIRSMA